MKCPHCGATRISKYGRRQGRQNYICKSCRRQFLESKRSRGYPEEVKRICLRMRQTGMSYRAIEQMTGVNHNTIINWVKKSALLDPQSPVEEMQDNPSETDGELCSIS